MKKFSYEDFACVFGTTVEDVKAKAGELIDSIELEYHVFEGQERDALVLKVIKRIHEEEPKRAGEERSKDWEDGWEENLREFIGSDFDISALKPKYYKDNVPFRFRQQYVRASKPDFIYKYTEIFREWLFKTFLAKYPNVYEFGCGTGHNLVHLASLYPEKTLYGLDWAASSQRIIEKIREHCGLDIRGGNFDFFSPNKNLDIAPDSAILTFGALEQLGDSYKDYVAFILEKSPEVCVDVAGINDFYSSDSLMDYLALSYHNQRNYLDRYFSFLSELENSGRVSILRSHKQEFGNLYDDPYSYIVWKPLGKG